MMSSVHKRINPVIYMNKSEHRLRLDGGPSHGGGSLGVWRMVNFTLGTNGSAEGNGSARGNVSDESYVVPRLSAEIQVVLYALIFVLAVVGNLLIIVTLIQNKRMRTVTNVFLLNLAVSDMLLAVFCMPFTLVPVLLQNFIFGAAMCVILRYLQAVSVGVSCFTLVAISLERYFAICRPLHSRSWQTLSHAYKSIAVCWVLAALLMTPVAVFQKHLRLSNDAHACRETWPEPQSERAYTVLLDVVLLVAPLLLMSLAYLSVVHALIYDVRSPSCDFGVPGPNGFQPTAVIPNYRTIELRLLGRDSCRSITSVSSTEETCLSRSGTVMSGMATPPRPALSRANTYDTETITAAINAAAASQAPPPPPPPPHRRGRHAQRIRHSNPRKIRENKMRVIRMLFVVVLEFFLCWTPVYVIQTWMVFDQESAYRFVTPLTKTLFHLLSYVSSCCNPITYCFMNKKFRESFLRVFTCRKPPPPLKERQRQQLMMLHEPPRGPRFNPTGSLHSTMSVRANSLRQFDFVKNINPIEEQSD
ncbi:cholecystokinin receptor type A-like isoform X2 [Pomacea canaliculata]|uniref:cholecystokinin receptor type A-like isoform X2 n=1 Tax=Pomacea canaliculata TaxID=400727 RepID=UPI000D73D858|nr:cholecystokinin receptor type A-like isoform X2 [Pomacea canaliculata]